MKIRITINDKSREIDVPEDVMSDGKSFFDKMDKDMDRGWQMGTDYVDQPNQMQRCQIAADKILDAIGTENETLLKLMAGYILDRVPDTAELIIDTSGEVQNTEIIQGGHAPSTTTAPVKTKLSKMEALAQANKDVGKVFKVGRSWRFAIFDEANDEWVESPLMDNKEQAEELRNKAFQSRYRDLTGEA
jgi:hypothetical protein